MRGTRSPKGARAPARRALTLVALAGAGLSACSRPAPSVSDARGLVRTQASEPQQLARTALVVGNSRYALGPLKNPVHDAVAMSAALGQVGFDVLSRVDTTHAELKRALVEFGARLESRGGVGLFYFSGHGIQVDGRNYLIPVDARLERPELVETEALAADVVLETMVNSGSRVNLLILDACRNDPFARSFRSAERGLAFMQAPTGTLIAYAAAPGKVASDGRGANGTYSAALLRHIGTPEVPIEALLKRVGADVEHDTGGRQTPWYASSLRGDFAFTTAGKTSSTAVSAAPTQPEDGVIIPAGPFLAGCDLRSTADCPPESSRERVEVPSFVIDRHEVTVAQYRECVQAGACSAEPAALNRIHRCGDGSRSTFCNWNLPGTDAHPMNCVDWFEADTYCKWKGKRLPTDHEWEKAARGAEGRRYPWGESIDLQRPFGNVLDQRQLREGYLVNVSPELVRSFLKYDDGFSATAPVGSFPLGASPYGVLDLIGNVWEWTHETSMRGGGWFASGPWIIGESVQPKGRNRDVRADLYGRERMDPRLSSIFGGFRCVKSNAALTTPRPVRVLEAFERLTDSERKQRAAEAANYANASRRELSGPGWQGAWHVFTGGALFEPDLPNLHWIGSRWIGNEGRWRRCFDAYAAAGGVTRKLDITWTLEISEQGNARPTAFRCHVHRNNVERCAGPIDVLATCFAAIESPSYGPACQAGSARIAFELEPAAPGSAR